ncbi:type III secretion system needle filament subunit SctF [Erwinia piriflorinigrans]
MPEGSTDQYFIGQISTGFESGALDMMNALNAALEQLKQDPSNPSVLANYQSKLQEYTLFRGAQSSAVKAYGSIGKEIIQKF